MTMREEHFEILIDSTSNELWKYLTTAEGLASWFGTAATSDLRIGGARTVGWGSDEQIEAEFSEIEPYSRVRLVYLADGKPVGAEEWLLTSEGSATRLTLIHSMPDDGIEDWDGFYGDMRRGWRLFMASLRHIAEQGVTPFRNATGRYFPTSDLHATWDRVKAIITENPDLIGEMTPVLTEAPYAVLLGSEDRSLLIDMEGAEPNMVMFAQASTHGGPDAWREEILTRLEPAAQR